MTDIGIKPRAIATAAAFCTVSWSWAALSSVEATQLELGHSIDREIGAAEIHPYRVQAGVGQYFRVVVDEIDVDVTVTVRDPSGAKVDTVNYWDNLYGPETVAQIAHVSGVYQLEVAPSRKKSGHYRISLMEQRMPTHEDRQRMLANADFSRAEKQFYASTGRQRREALRLYEQAQRLWEEVGDLTWQAAALNDIGTIYFELGELNQAKNEYERAVTQWRRAGNTGGEGISLGNLGRVFDAWGDYQQALDRYQKELQLLQSKPGQSEESAALHNLAMTYLSLNQVAKAEECYQQALAIAREAQDRYFEGHVLHHLGELYALGKRPAEARQALEQSLSLSRSLHDRLGEATNLHHLGNLLSSLGEFDRAIDMLSQALKLRRQAEYRQGEGQTLHSLARAYQGRTDVAHALSLYRQALKVRKEIGDLRGEAETRSALGALHQASGQLLPAKQELEKSLTIWESLRSYVINPEQRGSYFETVRQTYEILVEVLVELDHPEAALEASERAHSRILLEFLDEARHGGLPTASTTLVGRKRNLEREIDAKAERLIRLRGRPLMQPEAARLNREMKELRSQAEDIETEIRKSDPRYASLLRPPALSSKDIRVLLGDETLMVEYLLGDKKSYGFAVSQEAVSSFELPPRAELERACAGLYQSITYRNRSSEEVAKADAQSFDEARKLGQILVAPALSHWRGRRVAVVADGALAYLPFAALALPDSAHGEYLPIAAKYEVVNLPSASILMVQRQEHRRESMPKTLAVFADPVFSNDDVRSKPATVTQGEAQRLETLHLQRLLYSQDEAEAMASLVPAEQRMEALGYDANLTLARSPDLAKYRFVHFATHGIFDSQNPDLTGLVLSLVDKEGNPQDGFLKIQDSFHLHLAAEVVVLSACETALGQETKAEGLVGLTRGFMYAGARRVIASLWKVHDVATAKLMKTFYQEMLQGSRSPGAALREAQLALWRQARWSFPYYWGAFILQGDWR